MAVTYDIKAIPTVYRGRQYRSRLEAKWAALFERLGWDYEYEPVDLGPWSPDFSIAGHNGPIYVEVKPVTAYSPDVAPKMKKVDGEHLLVGVAPFRSVWMGLGLGWWVYGPDADADATYDRYAWCAGDGDVAVATRIAKRSVPGIIAEMGFYKDRISGDYDGDHHLAGEPGTEEIYRLWCDACNAVQWLPR